MKLQITGAFEIWRSEEGTNFLLKAKQQLKRKSTGNYSTPWRKKEGYKAYLHEKFFFFEREKDEEKLIFLSPTFK
jgi:hypothetical protein